MKLHQIHAGNFKLDGGAMFGVVPKSIWNKTNPADQNNMIEMCCRCLLIEDGNRLILVDTGMGNKQNEKFFRHYYRWGNESIDVELNSLGFNRDDITDVFLTHLHFDHCGGAVERDKTNGYLLPAFKNAIFWSNKKHWDWAVNPNKREKASFLKDNILPIEQSGQLKHISIEKGNIIKNSPLGFGIYLVDGHTEKQMIPMLKYKGHTICFAADLLPTTSHIPVPYVMGYDTRPLLTMKEKTTFLGLAAEKNWLLMLEHDINNELVSVTKTEKGVRLKESFKTRELF